jgi:anti-anti-sigma factor
MELDVRVVDLSANILMLSVSGKIKSGEADALQEKFENLCRKAPVRLILDIHAVDAVDSSGMGVLIQGRTDIVNSGGGIVLIGVTDRVSMLIKISGLDNFFTIAGSQSEAIQMLKKPPAPVKTDPAHGSGENPD